MKTYEVLKPITVPPAGIVDKDGIAFGASIISDGVICGDPESKEIKSFLENKCIKEQSAAKGFAGKVGGKGK